MSDVRAGSSPGAPADVKSWLSTALDAWFEEDAGRWAFRPFALHIGQRESDLARDLRTIYAEQPAIERARWRQAVRDLVAERGTSAAFRPALEVLLDLATLMPAPDVLDVLPRLVTDADGREANRLANKVVAAAVSLSSPTRSALDCLERIRTSPLFAPHHAGLVLTALCEVDPDRWANHVANLDFAMRALAAKHLSDRAPLRLYARAILRAITLSRVTAEALGELWNRLDCMDAPRLNWFFCELFEGKSSLIEYDHDAPRLWMRDNPSVCIPLEGKLPLANFDLKVLTPKPLDAEQNLRDTKGPADAEGAREQRVRPRGYRGPGPL